LNHSNIGSYYRYFKLIIRFTISIIDYRTAVASRVEYQQRKNRISLETMIPPSLRSILVGMAALSRAEYEATGWQAWLNQTCQRMITFAKLLHQLPRVSLPQRFPVLAEFLCPVAAASPITFIRQFQGIRSQNSVKTGETVRQSFL
jgi:hypothetical protein